MSAHGAPPPGSFSPSPDVSSMMQQFGQQQGLTNGQSGGAAGPGDTHTPPAQPQHPPKPPRPIGTPVQEAQYLAGDTVQGLKDLVVGSIRDAFLPKPNDTPEDLQKKKTLLENYNRLTDEDKAWADQKYQERKAEEQKKSEEKAQEEAQEKQKEEQEVLPTPAGKKTGATFEQDMNRKRTQLSGAG